MASDDHGIDVEEDTELETADTDDAEEVETEPPENQVGRADADSTARETDARETANPDDHRDEPPHDS